MMSEQRRFKSTINIESRPVFFPAESEQKYHGFHFSFADFSRTQIRSLLGLLYHNRPAFAKHRKRFAEKRTAVFIPDCPLWTKKRQFSFTCNISCYIITSYGRHHSRSVAMMDHQADDSMFSLKWKALLSILL